MAECKLYAVINGWQNIETVWAHTDIEAVKKILKSEEIVALTEEEVDKGLINIDAFCHEITRESIQIFDYECPDLDLVSKALSFKKTRCYGQKH
jgi:hypothetical protein